MAMDAQTRRYWEQRADEVLDRVFREAELQLAAAQSALPQEPTRRPEPTLPSLPVPFRLRTQLQPRRQRRHP